MRSIGELLVFVSRALGRRVVVIGFCYRNVDKVHDIMDDIQEAQELHDEISEVISQPVGFGAEIDEVSGSCMAVVAQLAIMCLVVILYLSLSVLCVFPFCFSLMDGVFFFLCFDKDELLAELEELEQQEVDEQLLEIPADALPSVPTSELPAPAAGMLLDD